MGSLSIIQSILYCLWLSSFVLNIRLASSVNMSESGGGVDQEARTTVSTISVPKVSLRPAVARTTITAGEEKQFICVVNDAPPVTPIVWKIGDIAVDVNDYTTTTQVGMNGKATMNSNLKRKFAPEENSKTLQCIAEGDWPKQDNAMAQTILDIQFPPVPQNAITLEGFEENEPGEVQVTVHANPRPHRAFWILPTPSNDKLEVEGTSVDDPVIDNNYVGHLGKDNGNDTFTYRLNITSVQQRDANPGIKFQVFNKVGTIEASEQYAILVVINKPDKTREITPAYISTTDPSVGDDDSQKKEVSDSPSPYLWILAFLIAPIIVCLSFGFIRKADIMKKFASKQS